MELIHELEVRRFDRALVGGGVDLQELVVRECRQTVERIQDSAFFGDVEVDRLVELGRVVERERCRLTLARRATCFDHGADVKRARRSRSRRAQRFRQRDAFGERAQPRQLCQRRAHDRHVETGRERDVDLTGDAVDSGEHEGILRSDRERSQIHPVSEAKSAIFVG
jgi:hypothetical protein